MPIAGATPTGYYLKKYLDSTIDISASTSSGGKKHSWVTYRLGEFYLNYAEAVFNYLGSSDAVNSEFTMSACEAINKSVIVRMYKCLISRIICLQMSL